MSEKTLSLQMMPNDFDIIPFLPQTPATLWLSQSQLMATPILQRYRTKALKSPLTLLSPSLSQQILFALNLKCI